MRWILINVGAVLFNAFFVGFDIRHHSPLPLIVWQSMMFGFQVAYLVQAFYSWLLQRELERHMEDFRKRFP